MTKKRVRSVPIYVWVRPDELEVIRERMAEAGIRNMSAYIRKMALGGYVLHVDLEPVKELVSLQRRCANNLNQAAIHANSYLHELEEPYKEVFMLHALGDIPLTRISQLFGKSDSWARVTYYRAKAIITSKLEEGEK